MGRAHARGPPQARPESGANSSSGRAGSASSPGARRRTRGCGERRQIDRPRRGPGCCGPPRAATLTIHARSDGYLLGLGGRGGSGFGWLRSLNSKADPLLIISARCCSSMSGLRSGAELTCMTQFGHKSIWPVPPQTAQRLRKIQGRVFPVPSHRRQSSMRRPVPHTVHVRRFRRFTNPTPPLDPEVWSSTYLARSGFGSTGSNRRRQAPTFRNPFVPPDRNKCQHIRQAARGRAWRSGSLRYGAIRRRGLAAPQRPTGARESCRRLDAPSWSSSKR
jgi:hypothetical protein